MIKIKRLLKSFIYAGKGLQRTFVEEQNFKIQILLAVVAIALGFLFKISNLEWCVLIFTISLVLLMELANSAVERVTDILKPRIHDYVKEIKDIMAATVFLASLVAIIIGLIIFLPYIIK
ncbi:MAG: diacylglycerol kinase family protein [Candidatus Falkowbacteria bacterium]|nr:diacylglycerol kinase family protein [Candidatus Falkowbacteria bacterium]